MLTLYKRHLPTCSKKNRLDGFQKKGGCKCPIWVEGTHDGRYRRHSLKTNSKAEAERQIEKAKHEGEKTKPTGVTVKEALAAWMKDCEGRNLAPNTIRKYGQVRDRLTEFADAKHLRQIAQFQAEM